MKMVEAPGIEPERSGVNPNHKRPALPTLLEPSRPYTLGVSGFLVGTGKNRLYCTGCRPYCIAIFSLSSRMVLHDLAIPTSIQICSISFFKPYCPLNHW